MNALKKLLREEVDGIHGESERRIVAEYVLDCVEDEGVDKDTAARYADYLAGAAKTLAAEIRKLP